MATKGSTPTKLRRDHKLETVRALVVEVYAADSELVYRKDVEFPGYYATGHHPQLPNGHYLGQTIDDALESVARTAAEHLRLEREHRERATNTG